VFCQVKTIFQRTAQALRRPARLLRHAARALAAAIEECNYARARLTQLQLSPDRHVNDPDQPPSTYAEFLFRSSGQLTHEPPARKRFVSPGHRH
jgi:hypothetical protein